MVDQVRRLFSWRRFVTASTIVVMLKIWQVGAEENWSFLQVFGQFPNIDFSAVKLGDWLKIAVILVEGLSIGAAITVTMSYVSIVNNRHVTNWFTRVANPSPNSSTQEPLGALTISAEDAKLVAELIGRANDQRVRELGEEVARLADQLRAITQRHQAELDARQGIVGFLAPIFESFETLAAKMKDLRTNVEGGSAGSP